MKLYEYIQALLDIQYLAGEDVEVVGSILDHYEEPINRKAGVIMPKLAHHFHSMEQVCIISVNDTSQQNIPEKDTDYVHISEVMGDDWVYGEAPSANIPYTELVKHMEEQNV